MQSLGLISSESREESFDKKDQELRVFVKFLLGLTRQHKIVSISILIQLNVVVILFMAQNLNVVIHKVIVWQLNILLRSAIELTNTNSVTLGCLHRHMTE